VADLLGKKTDELMPPTPKGKEYYWLQINYFLAEGAYLGGNFFFALFMTFLILSTIRILIIGAMALLEKKRKMALTQIEKTLDHPFVSIIVPAYNEEVNAVSSIQNLLKCNYPAFEIIFINDGSTDNTYQKRKNTDICIDPNCKGQLFISHDDGCLICSKCGILNGVLIDTEKVGNKENGNEKTIYAYKRLNHLKEIINQIQGQESVEIKDSVYADITLEINRRKLNKKDIDFFGMKKILKKLVNEDFQWS
jgi:cellulose synthase/poly-beta-1,6-N-acetylglucosamine synthase-like glycosyltransferase